MLASEFLKKLKGLNKEDLIEVKGIGEVLALNFEDFVNSSRYEKLLSDFEKLEKEGKGVEIKNSFEVIPESELTLKGLKICITGTFEISREEIKSVLEAKGAKFVGTVNSKTDYLLAGENPGSKLSKAEELGVKVLRDWKDI
jgi:DNA ligase (NAD+)